LPQTDHLLSGVDSQDDGRHSDRDLVIHSRRMAGMARGREPYFPRDTNIDSPKRNAPTTMMSAPA
jgi:hypothetical protein